MNASSITYLNLQLLIEGKRQALGVVAVDGAPVNDNGRGGNYALWQSHLGVPPGGRIEFIVKAPPEGTAATLITRSVNTGSAGENDPTRPLMSIVSSTNSARTEVILARRCGRRDQAFEFAMAGNRNSCTDSQTLFLGKASESE